MAMNRAEKQELKRLKTLNEHLERQIVVLRDVLVAIKDISVDYDGYGDSLVGCKGLIDEFHYMASEALDGRGCTYMVKGQIMNALDEIVGNYDPNDKELKLNFFNKNRKDY